MPKIDTIYGKQECSVERKSDEIQLMGSSLLLLGMILFFAGNSFFALGGRFSELFASALGITLTAIGSFWIGIRFPGSIVGPCLICITAFGFYAGISLANKQNVFDSVAILQTLVQLLFAVAGVFIGRAWNHGVNAVYLRIPLLAAAIGLIPALLYIVELNATSASARARAGLGFGHSAVGLAVYFSYISTFCLYLALWERRIFVIGALLSACAVNVFGVVITASRGPLFALACTWTFLILSQVRAKQIKPRTLICTLAAAIVATGAFWILWNSHFPLADRIQTMVDRALGSYDSYSGIEDSNRLDKWRDFVSTYQSWIFSGSRGYDAWFYPHNFVLELFVRYGLFAIPIVALIAFSFIRIAALLVNRNGDRTLILILALLIQNIVIASLSTRIEGSKFIPLAIGSSR